MFASSKSGAVADPKDAQFNYVTMLLHGNGTNGAQNNTFVDSSTNNFSITRNGNTTQGTFSPYGANWSNYFDGTGDYLNVASSSQFIASGNGFTVEAWVYYTSITDYSFIVASTTGANNYNPYWYIGSSNTGTWRLSWGDATSVDTGIAITLNTWHHVAISMTSGGSGVFYLNGVSRATATGKSLNGSNTGVAIAHGGGTLAGLYLVTGYISNVRYVKNSSVYTGAFTPSTTPLTAVSGTSLLTCADNRFIDDSTNNFTITVNGNTSVQRFSPFSPTSAYSTSVIGGSGYFDGTGDYLGVANNVNASGNFTYEFWMYATGFGSGSYGTMIGASSGSASNIFQLQTYSSFPSRILGYVGAAAGSGNLSPTLSQPILNRWIHIAVVRSGSTVTMYENGVSVATLTMANTINFGSTMQIGADGSANYPFQGYLTDSRLIVGTAVYTANFTPPTAPLTAISGTTVLVSTTNAAIIDNAMMSDLETVGNAQISTSVKKYGTGSIAFDGTDDRLVSATNPAFAFGTGDFTVEAWINTNVLTGERGFIQTSATVGGLQTSYTNGVIAVVAAGAGSYTININIAGTNIGGSVAVTTGTWYHVAFTRSSGSVRLFINGTLAGGPTTITANLDGQNVCIGGYYSTGYLWNGYVDDLRITKGFARYTSSFTPPTAAFADKG